VLPSVWLAFGQTSGNQPLDLLLTPHKRFTPGDLVSAIRRLARQSDLPEPGGLAYNESYAVGRFDLQQMLTCLLPLSDWYQRRVATARGVQAERERRRDEAAWLEEVVSAIEGSREATLARGYSIAGLKVDSALGTPLWLVSLNRVGRTSVWNSRRTIKADVSERAFDLDYTGIRWAVLDTGIDARHPAFRRRTAAGTLSRSAFDSRILKTYDFTRFRDILSDGQPRGLSAELREHLQTIRRAVARGRMVDWDLVAPLLEVPHGRGYTVPTDSHGTHVAGILAGDWRTGDGPDMPETADLRGVCPTLEIYDLRVILEDPDDPHFEEFSITAALQFLRFLNAQSDRQVVHGVNISLQLDSDVDNYAVGRTPICVECDRVVSNGIVAVAAAGNRGYERILASGEDGNPMEIEGFRDVTIADPGNARSVITVGSTHGTRPHEYGVSYFSSRGPTADGRVKPDVVAPGEKITSASLQPAMTEVMDGTSQAAPHVSGCAAALIARHRELIGQPDRVKDVLMRSATDLGRDRQFQGAGLVDLFRALQSV
jgi:subtilisin family serine protease